MPCQVSWHFDATKSQKLVHGLGVESAVTEAVVGMTSAADASAPAAASISAAKMPSLVMRAPCLDMDGIVTRQQPVRQAAAGAYAAMAGKFDPCGSRATAYPYSGNSLLCHRL